MKQKAYILDTHTIVWLLSSKEKLGKRVIEIFNDTNPTYYLIIPIIVLVEIKYLIKKGRLKLDYDTVLKGLCSKKYVEISQFDDYMLQSIDLNLNIHDSMIVATAVFYRDFIGFDVSILTKDQEIINSNLVDTIW